MTLVVIGDIHGNARALRAALDRARSGRMDRLIFVGDLLTYGHDVHEVIELVADAQRQHGAVLLIGNHDQMYFDLDEGRVAYYQELPSWIRDSVDLTREKLGATSLERGLHWSHEYVEDGVLVSHANPFGAGDFRYLADEVACNEASAVLGARAARIGIFGHTHRPRWGGCGPTGEPRLDQELSCPLDVPLVVNAGAVGQPRDTHARSVILRIAVARDCATATFESLAYDVEEHLAALRRSSLPPRTVTRLCAFFTPGAPA